MKDNNQSIDGKDAESLVIMSKIQTLKDPRRSKDDWKDTSLI